MMELQNLVKKFKEDGVQAQPEEEKKEGDLFFEKDGEVSQCKQKHLLIYLNVQKAGKRDPTMANQFEKNMVGMGNGAISSRLSMRRTTKKIDGTILSRHQNINSLVQK